MDAQVLNSNTVPEDPKIVSLLQADHQKVVDYVNGVIGTSTEAMSAATARYEDTAALDFINYVQAGAVKAELTGADADLPVLSIAAPFNKDAAIPQGDVSVRDIAGLYIYDNTLLGIKLTGAQVKAYLEKSAEYFKPGADPRHVRGRRPHQRGDADGAERDAGLQLRRHGRARPAADLRHRPGEARRQPDRRASPTAASR